jgi:hypothetical protein
MEDAAPEQGLGPVEGVDGGTAEVLDTNEAGAPIEENGIAGAEQNDVASAEQDGVGSEAPEAAAVDPTAAVVDAAAAPAAATAVTVAAAAQPPAAAPAPAPLSEEALELATWDLHSPPDTLEHVVRMRGLPWQIRAEDVLRFFRGAKLARNGLLVCFDSRGTGYAAFVSEEDRERALKKNRQHMGARCVRACGVCACGVCEACRCGCRFVVCVCNV